MISYKNNYVEVIILLINLIVIFYNFINHNYLIKIKIIYTKMFN